jgi:hypothetical protein
MLLRLPAERTALLAIKTVIDPTNRLVSWSSPCHCTGWAGITCTNGAVTNV